MKLELHFEGKDVGRLIGTACSGFLSEDPDRFETETTHCTKGQHGLSDPTIAKLVKYEDENGRDSCTMMWLTNRDNYLHAMIALAWHKKIYGEAYLLWDLAENHQGCIGDYVIWSPFNWKIQHELEATP